MLSNCGLEKNLESPLDSKIKSINPEYSLEELMLKLKLQYFSHMMWRADSLEKTLMLGKIEGNRKRGWWESGWDHQLNGHEFEQIQGDSEGQVSLACYSPWDRKEWDMTERQQQQQGRNRWCRTQNSWLAIHHQSRLKHSTHDQGITELERSSVIISLSAGIGRTFHYRNRSWLGSGLWALRP